MTARPFIETFNTHRMRSEVVRALATGRKRELAEVMSTIHQAVSQPGMQPQHMVVYGERGSGKSFLMRLVQLEVEELAKAQDAAVACVLLPEEQYNIRSESRLIEAITAELLGSGGTFSYAFDGREPHIAWEEALQGLSEALDARFGPGKGLLIAGVENFDTLAKQLFGAGTDMKSKRAGQQRAAEERLRKLMNARNARFLLLATATGTVDMDYERPLFQAFKPIDLTPWSGDTCIDYFNRRRELEQAPALSPVEIARARAITEFIGGNPRLAQLLGEVLALPDARTVADTLDALSDHLADYYRRRLDDLPGNATGLLDALIRQGEPCSQSELAARVNARQNQIADAFSYLTEARLLIGQREIGGPQTLYRVRDRLFVYFYRRRYGDAEQATALVRIAELLESFFTAKEKEEQAIHHLALGEFAEAQLYIDLRHREVGDHQDFCMYRNQDQMRNEPSRLFKFVGIPDEEIEAARIQLREQPLDACRDWGNVAASAIQPLTRAAAAGLQALAASRCGLDEKASDILRDALDHVQNDPDAHLLILDQMALFCCHRLGDQDQQISFFKQASDIVDVAQQNVLKIRGLLGRSFVFLKKESYEEAIIAADQAAELAAQAGEISQQAGSLRYKGFSLRQLGRHDEAITVLNQAAEFAEQAGDVREQAESLRHKDFSLGQLNRNEEAIECARAAIAMADISGDLLERKWSRKEFFRIAAHIATPDLVEQLAAALAIPIEDEHWLDEELDDVMSSAARKGIWPQLRDFTLANKTWLAARKARRVFDDVGRVWAEKVKQDGRATTFATVANDLPIIAEIMQLIPTLTGHKDSTALSHHLRDLINGLVAACDDAGFLRDIAELIVELFGPAQANLAERLNSFAEFHAAVDKEVFLQRINPDLATSIRKLWDYPEPKANTPR